MEVIWIFHSSMLPFTTSTLSKPLIIYTCWAGKMHKRAGAHEDMHCHGVVCTEGAVLPAFELNR